jgi:hypothetical protein
MTGRVLLAAIAVLALSACGRADAVRDPSVTPRPIAIDAGHLLPATPGAVAARRPIAGLPCSQALQQRYGVHVELFVDGLVVLLPAGIGIAPPWQAQPPSVSDGACTYPVRTVDPTGVVEVAPAARPVTLGDLFAVWGQPLSAGGFGPWRTASGEHLGVFLDGKPFTGDPRTMPLRPHAQIVLEVGSPRVVPHARYRFPPGL